MPFLGFIPIATFFLIYLSIIKFSDSIENSWREAFVTASIIWGVTVVIGIELLNPFHAITFFPILIYWLLATATAYLVCHRLPTLKFFYPEFKISSLSRLELATLMLTGMVLFLVGVVAFMAAPNSWDAVNYHMSRVAFWKQNHSVDYYPTPEFRQLYFQPWTAFTFLHFQVLTGIDRFATLVSWFSFSGCLLGVSLVVKLLGGNRTTQVLAAFIAATIPTAIVEASGVRIDMIVAFWLICFINLLLLLERHKDFRYVILIGLCGGLGALTKGTFILMMPPFGLWLIYIAIKNFGWLKAVRAGSLILLLAVVINGGFFYRNFQAIGSLMGPPVLRQWGLNTEMTPVLTFSNVIKTVGHELGNALPGWNKRVVKVIEDIHRKMNVDIADERSTYQRTPFFVSSTTHEDSVTNFLQVLLMIVSLFVVFKTAIKSRHRDVLIYIVCMCAAFVLVCHSIKWTAHNSRYGLPLFVLGAVPVAFFYGSLTGPKRWGTYILIFVLTVTAMPYVFRNNFRRLISSKKQTVFNTPRLKQYFRGDSSLIDPYTQAVEEVQKTGCQDLGLYMGFNTWDYPLWMLWENKLHQHGRIEHVYVDSLTPKQYPLGPFQPCALISVYYNEPEIVLGPQRFKKIKDFDKASVYLPNGPAAGPIVPTVFSTF